MTRRAAHNVLKDAFIAADLNGASSDAFTAEIICAAVVRADRGYIYRPRDVGA